MKKVLIAGGGVSGLCAGIHLQMAGYACTIFERAALPGGNLTGWNRRGCHIDNCLHWLTGTRPGTDLYRLWERCGILAPDCPPRRAPALFSSEGVDGRCLTFHRDARRAEEEFLAASPCDRRAASAFFRAVRDMAAEAVGQGRSPAARAAQMRDILSFGPRSLSAIAAAFRDPFPAAALTDYIGGDYSALGLIYAYAHFTVGNADLPAMSSRAAAARMADRFRALGGELHLSAPVLSLTAGAHEVRLHTAVGDAAGDAAILTCDPAVIFPAWLPLSAMPVTLARRYRAPHAFPVFSAFHAAFRLAPPNAENAAMSGGVCRKTDSGAPAGDAGAAFLAEGTHAFPVRPFRAGGRDCSRLTVRIHAPKEGGQVLQTMLFLHEEDCRAWIYEREADPAAYAAHKAALAAALLDRVAAHYPAMRGRLSLLDAWTPATYHRYLDSHCGAFMSFAVTGRALPLPISEARPVAPRVYLAGQWLRPPGGLPGAALSGRAAAMAVMAQAGAQG